MGLDPRQQHGGFLVARWKKKLLQAGCKDAQAGPDACYVAVPASQSNESPKPIPGSFLCARLRLRVLQSALQKKNFHASVENVESDLGAAAAAAATVVGAPRLRPPSRRFRWLP
jgi:hypothetical protein